MNYADILTKVSKIRSTEQFLMQEFRKGEILGTIHTSIGQEYVPVILAELTRDFMWFSNHRCHAHFLAKTDNYQGLVSEILAKRIGINMGIGGSQHLYVKNEFMSNGIQGGQMGLAMGFASSFSNSKQGSVIFIGDGTLGAGHIYEAMNLGAIFGSKTLIVLEDNGIAQSTPSSATSRGELRKRFEGFGLKYFYWSQNYDWRDSLKSFRDVASEAIQSLIDGPAILHVKVERLGPHSKGDDNRPKELILQIQAQDILNKVSNEPEFEFNRGPYLELEEIFEKVKLEDSSLKADYLEASNNIDKIAWYEPDLSAITIVDNQPKTLKEQINLAINRAISDHDAIFLGEDIEHLPFESGENYGGAFKISEGLSVQYPKNVFNTPISESGFVGFATGIALSKRLAIVEIMFSDFLSQCLDQIIHQISKIPSMYGEKIDLPIVIRTASGPGRGYGPTHSHTLENLFASLPNLIVVSINPYCDYSQIIEMARINKMPVLVYEPKTLYNSQLNTRPYSEYSLINRQNIFEPIWFKPKQGKPKATIIAVGHRVNQIVELLEPLYLEQEIFVDVFLPVTISKFNDENILKSIMKTKKLVIISDSIGKNPFFNSWSREVLLEIEGVQIHEFGLESWLPSGILEKEILGDKNFLENAISRIVRNPHELSNSL